MIRKDLLAERMLTTEDVSKWLGIAPRTLCTWAECGELPAAADHRPWPIFQELSNDCWPYQLMQEVELHRGVRESDGRIYSSEVSRRVYDDFLWPAD